MTDKKKSVRSFDKANSFVFYETYLKSIEQLDDEKLKLDVFRLITHYGLYGELIDDVSSISKSIFQAHRYNIDRSIYMREVKKKNGEKGGAPKGSNNNPNGNNQYKSKEDNQNEPKDNQIEDLDKLNVNEDVNVNGDVNEECSIFNGQSTKDNEQRIIANGDGNDNGIVKGRRKGDELKQSSAISLYGSKDFSRISKKVNISEDKVIEHYNYILAHSFTDKYGYFIETEDEFIDSLGVSIME